MIAPSQGIHLVFDGSFLRGDTAIMVPHTSDGRVLFAIPWHGHTVVGTTDTEIKGRLRAGATRAGDRVHSGNGGALFQPASDAQRCVERVCGNSAAGEAAGADKSTSALSRDHTIHVDQSGLLTIAAASGRPIVTWPRIA